MYCLYIAMLQIICQVMGLAWPSDHICPQLSGQFSLTQSNQDQCSVDLNLEQVEEAMLN